MSDPVSMKGTPGQNYQPADSSVIYLAAPDGTICNRDTGVPGVAPDHVARMQAMGCVLASQSAFSV